MMRNRVFKKILKNSIFKLLCLVNAAVPKSEDRILLYSANKGISHNLLPLREYLLEHGYNKKYKIICGIERLEWKDGTAENMSYTTPVFSVFEFLRAKYVFYTTGQIPIKPSRKQEVVQLCHGASAVKTFGKLSDIHNGNEYYFNHVLTTSEFYREIMIKAFGCRQEDIFFCGEPMVDAFYQESKDQIFGGYHKFFLWAPTFRQSDYLGYDDSSAEELLPMFLEEEYGELNEECKRHDFLLLVKLHPMQDTKRLKSTKFSHLKIYSDQEFVAAGLDLYRLLPQIDVLLADYSTVYTQFYLLDKPIGFVVPDMEEYKEKRGFVFSDPEEYMAGEIIRTKEELYRFFDDMEDHVDRHSEKRKKLRDLMHQYQDGGNCRRILEYVGIAAPPKDRMQEQL